MNVSAGPIWEATLVGLSTNGQCDARFHPDCRTQGSSGVTFRRPTKGFEDRYQRYASQLICFAFDGIILRLEAGFH